MPKPTLHPHQSAPTAPAHEARFEFDSADKNSGGLFTLTDTGEGIVVDLYHLDPTVRVRVPQENLWTKHPRFSGAELRVLARLVDSAVTDGTLDGVHHSLAQVMRDKLAPYRED